MKDSPDLRHLLRDWPFDPAQDARLVHGEDGREILQVRTPLGIEQLEMAGRPDGVRPHGLESALEYHRQRLAQAQTDFELSADDCAELFVEGTLYYCRYLRLFQLGRWAETVRDTTRNLRLFDFVRQYASREEDRDYLEKWRPYILRMNASVAGMLAVEKGAHAEALEIVNAAIQRIESLDEMNDETFKFEQQRSVATLHELAAQIEQNKPMAPLERLERQLHDAVAKQDFERAAQLRDRLRELRGQRTEN
jgi:hypothetical protein